MFLQVSVCPHWGWRAWLLGGGRGGICMVAPGGHVWLLPGGHAWLLRGVCGYSRGGAWLLLGGRAWFLAGGWVCMVFLGGGMRCFFRGCMRSIRRDMVNERAVRILLECILVIFFIMTAEFWICFLLINYCGFNTGMISCTTKSRNLDPNLS